jgi:hypothetical protein
MIQTVDIQDFLIQKMSMFGKRLKNKILTDITDWSVVLLK